MRFRPRVSPFGVVVVLAVTNHLVLTGARVAVPLDALAHGARAPIVGSLMALFALLPMFLAIAAGRLADRVGVRRPMLAGSIGMGASTLVAALVPGVAALFLTAMLAGVSFMLFQVAAQYATGEMGADGARTHRFALLALGLSTSSIGGPLIAGFAIDHFGYRATFAMLALLPLVPVGVLAANRVALPGAHPARAAAASGSPLDLIANRAIRRAFFVNGLVSVAWELHTLFVPIYGNAIGLSASRIGLVLGAFGAATFVVRLAMPVIIARRFAEHRVLTFALFIAALVYLALPFSRSVYTLMALSFCLGLGLGASQPMVMSLLHANAPPGRMGEAAGLRLALVNSMAFAVPLVFGAIGGRVGLGPLLLTVSACLATGGWLTARGASPLRLPAPLVRAATKYAWPALRRGRGARLGAATRGGSPRA